jgi:hypothetical protein
MPAIAGNPYNLAQAGIATWASPEKTSQLIGLGMNPVGLLLSPTPSPNAHLFDFRRVAYGEKKGRLWRLEFDFAC